MSTIKAVPAVLRTESVRVTWTDGDGKDCSAVFQSVLGSGHAQGMALAFIADSPRDTAYTLVHPEPQR